MLGDHSAHGLADDVRGVDVQGVEQAGGVVGHVGEGVAAGGELLGEPDVAVVEADDVVAAVGELLAELLVPAEHVCTETLDQHHRGVVGIAERVVVQRHPMGGGGRGHDRLQEVDGVGGADR